MKKIFALIAETIIIGILSFYMSFYNIFETADSLSTDILYQNPRGINNKIKIIAIDEKTISALGPFGTWSRNTYAKVINKLGDYPAVIGLDITIFGEMDKEGDAELIRSCKNSGKVVSASELFFDDVASYNKRMFSIEKIEYPMMGDAVKSGFVNVICNEDGTLRSVYPQLINTTENGYIDSFSSVIYKEYCENEGISPTAPKLDKNGRMWIHYAGKPGDYEHISLIDVLNEEPNANPKLFSNCIVLMGAYTSGLQDQFTVPRNSDQMYGVEIHANIVQSMLDGCYPVPVNKTAMSLITSVVAMLAFLVFYRIKIKVATPLFIVLTAGYIITGLILYNNNLIVPLLYIPLFLFIAYLISLIKSYLLETVEKKKITSVFKKYVAPQVVDEIMKSGKYHIKLGGENRHIAVLFVDIRGFTPISESLEPEQVVDILNCYLNLTTNAIFKNMGTLDKFIGDATMAVFNAPFDLDDYVFRAVCAAWDIVQGGNEIESKFLEKYGKSVSFGVGVNCGNAVVGNIGCDFRMDYTAIGDTVNTAARLESNAKRGQVLISEYVYEQIKDRITVEEIGEIPLKGKSKGVFVYSLTGISR
jgi:adenylate cyclase